MNRLLLSSILAISVANAAQPDHRTWKWQQEIPVVTPGLIRLELPPQTLDICQPTLADLRVISPEGAQIPYLIDSPMRAAQTTCAATQFKANLVEGRTVLEASNPTQEPVTAISLVTPGRNFLKSLQVEAAGADGAWQIVNASDVVFHDPSDVARLTIPIPAQPWARIRVTLDDQRTLPVPFTGMKLTLAMKQPPAVSQPVTISQTGGDASQTTLELDLGAANLMLAELQLQITDSVFMRHCSLSYPSRAENGETELRPLGQHSIYRVTHGGGASISQLALPIHQRIPSRHLVLTIHHKDNPRLDVPSAQATRYPTELVFYAAKSGSWQLLAGQPLVDAPDYDISRLRSQLGSATRVTPGPLTEKPDYIKPNALPDIDPLGATIDLTAWACRKPVLGAAAGIVRIELDAEVLAGSQDQLGDLRLIQNGRQIPFVVSPATRTASLSPRVSEQPDAQRPGISRWQVDMPLENLPATRLTAGSSSPLFSRRFEMSCDGGDGYGNRMKRFIAAADWTKTVAHSADSRLILNLNSTRLPGSFTLETDNGDNPAIALEEILVEYPVPSILAKITDPAALHLYYANPSARAPRYDLNLVSTTLRSAEKAAATLGEEQVLKPGAVKRNTTSGSPWLWLALGGVVVVLLLVVAKLLPKQEEKQKGNG